MWSMKHHERGGEGATADIDLRKPQKRRRVQPEADLGNRKRCTFTIHMRSGCSPLGYPIVPITRLSARLNAGGQIGGSDRPRVFLRLAAHLNISLLRKAH